MAEQLKIQVGAEVEGLISGFNKANSSVQSFASGIKGNTQNALNILNAQLQRLEKIASQAGLSFQQFDRVNSLIRKTEGEIKRLSVSADRLNPSLAKVVPISDRATLALSNLGRVAQDAPFGFLGIANNLNPLLESFQRLQKDSGSTRVALSSMLSALTGPAGIGLGLSVVSSLLITFGDKLFGSKKKIDEQKTSLDLLKESLDEAKKGFDDLVDSVGFLNQIASVNIEIGGFGKVLDFQGQIVAQQELVQKSRELEQELRDEQIKLFEQGEYEKYDALQKSLRDQEDVTLRENNKLRLLARQLDLQRVNDLKESLKKQSDEYKKFLKELQDAFDDIKELGNKALKELRNSPTPIGEFKIKKFDPVGDLIEKGISVGPLEIIPDKITLDKELNLKIASEFNKLFNEIGVLRPPINFELAPSVNKRNFEQAYQQALKSVQVIARRLASDLNKEIPKALERLQEGVLIAVGQGLGDAISGGGLQSLFASLFNVLGTVLQQLGETLIELGIGLKAIKEALKTLNPALAIAAGIGLIAIGGVIKNSVKNIGAGLAEGGIVPPGFPNDTFPARLTSNEAVIPLNRLDSMIGGGGNIVVTGRLRGQDLLLQNRRTQRSQRRTVGRAA